jgi:hypothetical protein
MTKITITDEMFLTLKSSPNDKLLLSLCLHYDIYDKVSQRKIDELCQLSLTTERGLNVFVGDKNSAEKENISVE